MLFRSGVSEPHRDQIEVVLARQSLAAVAETVPGRCELLGSRSPLEERVWRLLEERGLLSSEDVEDLLPDQAQREALELLVTRRLAFRSPISGRYHALSRIVDHLM